MTTPEQRARLRIDELLAAAGWSVQDFKQTDLHAARGVAIREFELNAGFGTADYLLYVDGRAAASSRPRRKARRSPASRSSPRSTRRAAGQPSGLAPPAGFPLRVDRRRDALHQRLDPEPRARNVFAFHRPETLADALGDVAGRSGLQAAIPSGGSGAPTAISNGIGEAAAEYKTATFLSRVRAMPELVTEWSDVKLWPAQITAIRNLEASLAQNKPRALIQMAPAVARPSPPSASSTG